MYPIPLFQPFHNGYLLVIFSNYLRRLYVAHATAGAIAYSRILPRHHKLIPIFRAHLPAQSSMLTFQQFSRCGNHFTVFGSCRQNVFSQCQSRSNDQLHPCCSIASNHTTRDVRIDRLLQCLRLIRCLECFYQDYDMLRLAGSICWLASSGVTGDTLKRARGCSQPVRGVISGF